MLLNNAHPLSFLAAMRKMMAGFEVTSMWALVNCPCDTTHCDDGPQYTRANAIVPNNNNHGNQLITLKLQADNITREIFGHLIT